VKAVVYERYGSVDVLRLGIVGDPEPTGSDVVVRVHAAALNPKDALFRRGRFARLSGRDFPKRVGVDFAGIVDAAGPRATLAVGTRVFGALSEWRYTRGTLAERVLAHATEVAPLPEAVDFVAGAAIALCGLTSLQALRDLGRVKPGDVVAIHGASGGVGTLAIQIARVLGTRVVTTSSARNVPLCRDLGADEALDYEDRPLERPRGDVACLFDVFGNLRWDAVKSSLRRGGVLVTTVPSPSALLHDLASRVWGHRRLVVVRPNRRDLETLGDWLAAGRVRPVLDSVRPLSEMIDAHRVLESKRARGKIVLRVP
jgi:NADPH:quinone reductase-like Zn-dependent oxidoreductase